MMDAITWLLVIVKFAALGLGGVVTLLAYRAYERTQFAGLRYFAIGLFIITVGTVLVGVFHHFLHVQLTMGMLLESSIICVGFGVMVVGLYGQ
ncbi:hypothetical protein BG842_21705 [Haladaptatus sp. W1]|nr:hypothetical protein BG842_21705 [Haladaptatus sp. W1]